MPGATLYSFGPLLFEVYPLNVGEVDHATATEWSRKEIAGAAIYREWVGENDETINLRGKVFPHFFARRIGGGGGLNHLDVMDNMRKLGQAHTLVRGGSPGVGTHLGWFVIERLTRGHSFLHQDGIGQQIQFDATFQRVPVPQDASTYYWHVWTSPQV